MAKNTREMMVSLVSHLSARIETASPNEDFGSGWSGAMDFVMASVKATVTEGERGRASLSEEQKAERLAKRAPLYLSIIQNLSSFGAKATAGAILKAAKVRDGEEMLPRSEQNIGEDLDCLAATGDVKKSTTKGGRTFYEPAE